MYIVIACLFALLSACASTNIFSNFSSGELKNSLPLFDKDKIEETHSVSIPQFFNDNNNWTSLTQEILSSAKLSIIPYEKTANAVKAGKKDLHLLSPEERADHLTALARSLHADAVLNGLILNKDSHNELVLQLLSSKDSRVIWWQSVDFSVKHGAVVQNDQKTLLIKMLSPVLQYIGQKEKPLVSPFKQQPKIDALPKIGEQPVVPKTEPQPKIDIKPKPKKELEKDLESPVPDDDFSPM